jgi:mercuric ion transport protein
VKDFERSPTQRVSIGGAILAALAASSCCIGPLILAGLGVGGAGAFSLLARYRYPILLGAAALLGTAFYLTYRAPGTDSCGCDKRKSKRGARLALWLGAALTVVLAAAPSLLSRAYPNVPADRNITRVVRSR